MGIESIEIVGYKPFGTFKATVGNLEVIVGANGSGKSALFEFLRFLRDSVSNETIPPEIVPGSVGQQIFHDGDERIAWQLTIENPDRPKIANFQPAYVYDGELLGPVGRPIVISESVTQISPHRNIENSSDIVVYLERHYKSNKKVLIINHRKKQHQEKRELRPNQLALSTITTPEFRDLYDLREHIRQWRFYSGFNIAKDKIRRGALVEQDPTLNEDCGNLSSVLHSMMTEHPQVFQDLQQMLRSMIPGFKSLSVKARGAPGEVIAFWREQGFDQELSLSDLSDGILRLLCWTVLCLQPNPPTLICVDEPDQGVHPRTLPILAGLFMKTSQKTQVILATHASYFLTQFKLEHLAIMRKENGQAVFAKPTDSKLMMEMLKDFGTEELEHFHRSDELERFS